MDLLPIIERYGYTVTSLARKMDMAQSNLYKLVHTGNPTVKTLARIAHAMGISVLELLGKDKSLNTAQTENHPAKCYLWRCGKIGWCEIPPTLHPDG